MEVDGCRTPKRSLSVLKPEPDRLQEYIYPSHFIGDSVTTLPKTPSWLGKGGNLGSSSSSSSSSSTCVSSSRILSAS